MSLLLLLITLPVHTNRAQQHPVRGSNLPQCVTNLTKSLANSWLHLFFYYDLLQYFGHPSTNNNLKLPSMVRQDTTGVNRKCCYFNAPVSLYLWLNILILL